MLGGGGRQEGRRPTAFGHAHEPVVPERPDRIVVFGIQANAGKIQRDRLLLLRRIPQQRHRRVTPVPLHMPHQTGPFPGRADIQHLGMLPGRRGQDLDIPPVGFEPLLVPGVGRHRHTAGQSHHADPGPCQRPAAIKRANILEFRGHVEIVVIHREPPPVQVIRPEHLLNDRPSCSLPDLFPCIACVHKAHRHP